MKKIPHGFVSAFKGPVTNKGFIHHSPVMAKQPDLLTRNRSTAGHNTQRPTPGRVLVVTRVVRHTQAATKARASVVKHVVAGATRKRK